MKIKCYSVRIKSLVSISDKAYRAKAFDGPEAIIPKSQVFGRDYDVQKSDAWWIASWFLEKDDVHLQCSFKKEAWFDKDSGKMMPTYHIEKHKPEKIESKVVEPIKELQR